MVRRQGFWMVALALVAGNTLSASVIRTQVSEFRHLYTLNPNGRVVIENVYGDVSITAWDRDAVLVEAVKRSPDPSTKLDDACIVVEPTADRLSIRTQYSGSVEHPASVEYRITVPRGVNLQDVKLINGGLSISGVSGAVKASAVNGSIRARSLTGQAELSTVNGRVDADFLALSRSNPISLSSVNGSIHISIPTTLGTGVVASNMSGGIASDVGHVLRNGSGHHLIVKGNGPQIRVRNINGGISIHSHDRLT